MKPNKINAKPVRFNSVIVNKAVNGYVVGSGNSSRPYDTATEHVFETDAALFKFLRKHFCEGYK